MSQSNYTHFSAAGYRLNHGVQNTLHSIARPIMHARHMSISELLSQVERVTTPQQLTKLVNNLQTRLWNLSPEEQGLLRGRLADMLTTHVLEAPQASLRLEAAGWLRLFVQAAYLAQPEQVFVTLVTSAARASISGTGGVNERAAYLKMILDCFWPFRYPYPALTWEIFPANAVFYPLAPLLSQDDYIQDTLVAIFAELPTLDDPEIEKHLLPVALKWSHHPDADRRQRITTILGCMSHSDAQKALNQLRSDADPVVQASACRAAENVCQA